MGRCLPAGRRRGLDLGSGGGVPGLVLAVGDPELELVLLDAGRRPADFLRGAVTRLGLADRTVVVEERAETAARRPELREALDFVVARSFGPPALTAECAVGFLRLGGALVVSEPPDAPDRWPAEGLDALGLGAADRCGEAGAGFVRLVRERIDDRWPRRVGIPAKRPAWD